MAPRLQLPIVMRFVALVLALVSGCVVGSESGSGRGGGGKGDGTGGGESDPLIDGGAGSGAVTCTGAAYDPCNDPSQCMSGQCQLYGQAGFQVCTATCTPGDPTTCPQQNGQAVQC